MAKITVDTREFADSGHGRPLKNWTKLLTGVDAEKNNGYAFLGEFGPYGGGLMEVELSSHLLHYYEAGSRKNNYPNAVLYRVGAEGPEEIGRWDNLSRQWALEIRDEVAELITDGEAREEEVSEQEIADAIGLLESAGYIITRR